MKSMTKKLLAVLMAAVMLTAFVGCELPFGSKFDAVGYVQGMLDASYKGEFDKFAELVDDTPEQLSKDFEAGIIDVDVEDFISYFGIEYASDETRTQIADFYKELFKKAKYDVKQSSKNGDDYIVEVALSPLNIFSIIDEDYEVFVNQFNETIDQMPENPTEEEIMASEETYAAGVLQICNKHLANVGYEAEEKVTVTVRLGDDDLYSISDAEFTSLCSYIVTYA